MSRNFSACCGAQMGIAVWNAYDGQKHGPCPNCGKMTVAIRAIQDAADGTNGTGVTELTQVRLRLRQRETQLRQEADRLHGLGAPRDARACADHADLIDEIVRTELLPREAEATGVDPAALPVPVAVTTDGPRVEITLNARTMAEAWSALNALVIVACESKSGGRGWPQMVACNEGKIQMWHQWEPGAKAENTP